jgi:hypothetical protein
VVKHSIGQGLAREILMRNGCLSLRAYPVFLDVDDSLLSLQVIVMLDRDLVHFNVVKPLICGRIEAHVQDIGASLEREDASNERVYLTSRERVDVREHLVSKSVLVEVIAIVSYLHDRQNGVLGLDCTITRGRVQEHGPSLVLSDEDAVLEEGD